MRGKNIVISVVLLLLGLPQCKRKGEQLIKQTDVESRTIILPADCREDDSLRALKADRKKAAEDAVKEKKALSKKKEGLTVKGTLDSLAVVVDKYIARRDQSKDSATWYRWEDSVKAKIVEGNILMAKKVNKLTDVDNTRTFKNGFKK